MITAINKFGTKGVCDRVAAIARQMKVPEYLHIDYVCRACCEAPELAPDMSLRRKNNLLSPSQCLEKWVEKFLRGYNNRISCCESNIPSTIPDDAIGIIMKARIANLSDAQVECIVYAHRLAMSAENILGLLLEEFLFEKLSSADWAMAWGETIRAVDFCDKNGRLLQIKNRSNSENSSSKKIRKGEPIEKWFRVDAATGQYEWDNLAAITGRRVADLNEVSFQSFIRDTVKRNPKALAIESENPWQKLRN